jgi:hypothetical protein
MERYNARKRLKSARRRDCPKTPLRSFARGLAATPAGDLQSAPPSREMLVQASRDWLRNKAAV